MQDSFNPYSEWLGLPLGEGSPSFYRLLGLDDFEKDPKKIARAADVAQTTLRGISPGRHSAEWRVLRKQLEEAQQCLTNPVTKVAYDSALQIAPPPDAPRIPAIAADLRSGADGSDTNSIGLPVITTRNSHCRRRSHVGRNLVAIAILGMLAAAAILYFVKIPTDTPLAAGRAKRVASTDQESQQGRSIEPASALSVERHKRPSEADGTTSEALRASSTSGNPPTAVGTSSAVMIAQPVAQAAPDTSEPAPTKAEIQAFRAAIQDVIQRLGARQLEKADMEIVAAKRLAVTAEQKLQFRGLQMLQMAVSNFWAAVRESTDGLSAGQEFEHKGLQVVVVESSPGKLVLRAKGKNYRFDPDHLKPGLARTLARLWFDADDPTTPINLGAFLFVEPGGDRKKAAMLWQTAADRGEAVEPLLKLAEIGRENSPLSTVPSRLEPVDQ